MARTVTASYKRPTSPDPYLYAEGETLAAGNLDIVEIDKGIYLGRAKSDTGLSYGLILTSEEKNEYESQTEFLTLNLADADGLPEAFFHRESHDAFLAKIEARHIAYPSRTEPRLRPYSYVKGFGDTDTACLSPFAAARQAIQDGKSGVLVIDILTMKQAFVSSVAGELLSLLSIKPHSLQDLEAMGYPLVNGAALAEFLENLKEKGILITTRCVQFKKDSSPMVSYE
jgi:hypothetical protein